MVSKKKSRSSPEEQNFNGAQTEAHMYTVYIDVFPHVAVIEAKDKLKCLRMRDLALVAVFGSGNRPWVLLLSRHSNPR